MVGVEQKVVMGEDADVEALDAAGAQGHLDAEEEPIRRWSKGEWMPRPPCPERVLLTLGVTQRAPEKV